MNGQKSDLGVAGSHSTSVRAASIHSRRGFCTLAGVWLTGLVVFQSATAVADTDPQHPLAPAIEHATQARDAVAAVKDYEAVFSKRELVGRNVSQSEIILKFREQPYSVYMHFVKPHKGREVIYVQGRNNGNLLAHETGLKSIAGTVSLAPDSETAMDGNRYPITMVGMKNLVSQVIRQWEEETKYGEVDVKFYPDARLGDVSCKVIESKHPNPRRQFRFHMTRLYIDKANGLPVRVEQWAFPQGNDKAQLIEEYTYTKVRANVGLQDRDFDTTNPNYAFPR